MKETVRLIDSNTKITKGTRRTKVLAFTVAFIVFSYLYVINTVPHPTHHYAQTDPTVPVFLTPYNLSVHSDYLIWTPNCKIPNIDPFAKDAMHIFKPKKYVACTTHRVTSVIKDANGNGVLIMNASLLEKPLKKDETLVCCYSNVSRSLDPEDADSKIVKSKCIPFDGSITLLPTEEFIITKCEVPNKKSHKKTVHEDAHTNLQIPEEVKQRFEALNSNLTKKPWNVLIIGIDTLSRINLARALPKTNKFLKKNNWIDFQGYNKIDDNTYPNLMAILTGRNQSRARHLCEGKGSNNSLDNCDFMWKRYQKVGYATAYAEDYVQISTFGKPLHTGFTKPPTDHYPRPLLIAAEKRVKRKYQDVYCTGKTTSGEFTFDYALDFVNKYEKHPFFGFFWMNTYSHDDVNTPSTMDEKIMDFFLKLNETETMNSTIIIFISDHGLRFGDMRSLLTGYYEERLPSFFIWLPPSFIDAYPEHHKNMLANAKRLTNPYDLYMTLQDILYISEKKALPLDTSEGCPTCQTLFQKVSWNRTCDESGILPHWCTCNPFEKLPTTHKIAGEAIKYVIDVEIENALNTVNTPHCRLCAKLNLDRIQSVYLYKYLKPTDAYNDYLGVFSAKPGTMVFEATIRHFIKENTFKVQGIVSRLTPYKGKGGCVKSAYLKKYCYCTNNTCHGKS